jgi:hypothetical protein
MQRSSGGCSLMVEGATLERALAAAARDVAAEGKRFALVGGLAVSVRAEVRVDLDLDCLRDNLRLIAERGYARRQDLAAKLTMLLEPSP